MIDAVKSDDVRFSWGKKDGRFSDVSLLEGGQRGRGGEREGERGRERGGRRERERGEREWEGDKQTE